MDTKVIKIELTEIKPFRVLFLKENNFQFVHDKCHLYGWADTYLFKYNEIAIGYGAVWGLTKREDRDAIFEFFVIKPYRKFVNLLFSELCKVSNATVIECQSNDPLLSTMLYEFSKNVNAEAILFKDHFQTFLSNENLRLQKKASDHKNHEYVLEHNNEVVASGGLMLNYNMPYADIYYEVNEQHRQKGFGKFMVQELKNEAYKLGRVPAARCNINNTISKATLLTAGFEICGHILLGEIKKADK